MESALEISKDLQRTSVEERRLFGYLAKLQGGLKKFGVIIETHSLESHSRFKTLDERMQRGIVDNIARYTDFIEKCILGGMDIRIDYKLTNAFLKEFGFIYDKDLLETLDDGDIIEVYATDTTQIFRNMRFFDVCTYPVCDLFTHNYAELYERSEKVKDEINKAVFTTMTRPFDTTPIDLTHIKPHLLREKFTNQKLTSIVQFKKFYPLYLWPNELAGFLVTQEGKNIPNDELEISFL